MVVPKHWGRRIHPRRGGIPGPKIKPDTAAEKSIAQFVEAAQKDVERVLGAPKTDPELVAAARAHLGGDPDPRGAAVLALIARGRRVWPGFYEDLVDAWAFAHGVVFAACAQTEMAGLDAQTDQGPGGGTWTRTVRPVRPDERRCAGVSKADRRVRSFLAAATDDEYAEAVERLGERRTLFAQRVLTAYLVPTRQDWVTKLCEDPDGVPRNFLLPSLGSPEQLELLGPGWTRLTLPDCFYPELLRAFAEGVGPAVAPLMVNALDRMMDSAPRRKGLLDVLGALPSDEAFRALVERRANKHISAELMKAMSRFPVRALRELAAAGATDLLDEHVKGSRELAEAALPVLPDAAREAVERVVGSTAGVAVAAPEELPALLVDPPWARPRKKPKPVAVEGLTVPDRRAVRWGPCRYGFAGQSERDDWAREHVMYPSDLVGNGDGNHVGRPPVCERSPRWERYAENFAAGRLSGRFQLGVLMLGPDELTRPLLAGWTLDDPYNSTDRPERWCPILAARYELDALPIVLPYAKSEPPKHGWLLVPFLTAEVAALMADWLVRLKKARKYAEAWLSRHGADAVPLLVPAALGKAGPPRRAAEGALRHLAGELGGPAVVEASREHGDEAARAVEALLATEQPDAPQAPRLPAWADPALLPQILLKDRRRALPESAVRHVLTILTMSTPEEPHPGAADVQEASDAASLAAFTWELFVRWRDHGERAADAWALTALGPFGDDEAARRLAPLIHAWPGENGHPKAVRGVDALVRMGSETALMQLDAIARKAKFGALQEHAEWKMGEVADGLGLTGEQLADRLVPSFGLDTDGGMTLDYGPRRFRVGFDEALKPYVTDADGRRLKALPKPGAKDDSALAPAAYRAFGELKKDVRTIAGDQVKRLERAMVSGRTWTLEEFGDLFVRHPLVWHIARRLVWTCDGVPFRLAEDRTFADLADETLTPGPDAVIALSHPVVLGPTVGAWSQVFLDYELTQPFAQLARPVYELVEEERAAVRLARFEGASVPFGKVLGLTRRGWVRGEPISDGLEEWISRPLPGGLELVVHLDPGIAVGQVDHSPEQRLTVIWLGPMAGRFSTESAHPFGELDPPIASEILADLTAITERSE